MSKVVGEEIRRSRLAAGLSQAEVARRLDVSGPYVANVEAGRANLTIGQMANIAAAMGAGLEIHFRNVEREELQVRSKRGSQRRV